jgi:hypothetical protein
MPEDLYAQVLERPLPHPVDQEGLHVGGAPVEERGADEHDQEKRQPARVAVGDRVDRPAGEVRGNQRGGGGHRQRDQGEDHPRPVRPQEREQVP